MSEAEKREERGQKHLDAAREARFTSNGEPDSAPTLEDAVKERKELLRDSK